METLIPALRSARLLLRPFVPADAPDVQTLAGAPEIAAAPNAAHPYPDGAAASWIATRAAAAARGEGFTWAITRRADGTLLGAIGLGVAARHQRGEIGYSLGVPFWQQGYTTEAARRVVAFGVQTAGLHRIEAGCFPRNAASARVLEKTGLRYEGTLRGYVLKVDAFEDVAMYGILRTEWDG